MDESKATASKQCTGPSLHHMGLLTHVGDLMKASALMKGSEQWNFSMFELTRMLPKLVVAEEDYVEL